jgi:hypothetical protein
MEHNSDEEIKNSNSLPERGIHNRNTLITTMATENTRSGYRSVVSRSIIQMERDCLQQPDDYERIIEVTLNFINTLLNYK